jgi:hypothetical protein
MGYSPCLILLRHAGGWPAAIFYPLGHSTLYACANACSFFFFPGAQNDDMEDAASQSSSRGSYSGPEGGRGGGLRGGAESQVASGGGEVRGQRRERQTSSRY